MGLHLFEYMDANPPQNLSEELTAAFWELGYHLAQLPMGPETSAALRKLMECRDCAVRAAPLPEKEPEKEPILGRVVIDDEEIERQASAPASAFAAFFGNFTIEREDGQFFVDDDDWTPVWIDAAHFMCLRDAVTAALDLGIPGLKVLKPDGSLVAVDDAVSA